MHNDTQMNRRGFALTSLASGFALAVQPVAASTIATSSDGLIAGEVKIPTAGGQMPAYRAVLSGVQNAPVILVVHEIFGVHEWIKDICRRFAKAGFMAVAPDLFARAGDATKYTDIRKLIDEIVLKTPDDQVHADLDATASWAAGEGGNTKQLSVTGFCWGGRVTWLYAAHNPNIKAGVAWYGTLVKRGTDPRPVHPIDVADKIDGRVIGLYAQDDPGIPLDSVEAMRAALRKAGDKQSDILVYNGAKHGFLADYRPSFNQAAAVAGWNKALEWLHARGAAGSATLKRPQPVPAQ
ncbi:MAG TPA: carboxymethylenebutenolidase [Alphaproteobacteria bacterium]|nr:carboxymethylenebutenolidase [Alphaproteobacteria bacterium]HAJ48029.1 carboxymethylenebutenolidase [Alphaproteobacteria bacterium]